MAGDVAAVAEFLARLLQELPELRPLYEEHIEFNGEVLPYVLMDEMSRHALDSFEHSGCDSFKAFADCLESELVSGTPEVGTLIRTSFAESVDTFWNRPEVYRAILRCLGPRMQAALLNKPR